MPIFCQKVSKCSISGNAAFPVSHPCYVKSDSFGEHPLLYNKLNWVNLKNSAENAFRIQMPYQARFATSNC